MNRKKTIFITGGATGIGAAAVRKFISEGWNVAFMDINREGAAELTASLLQGADVYFHEGNTARKEDIHQAVEGALVRFGGLDSVFANAGIHRKNTLLDITDEELKEMIDINIYGNVNTLRECVPHIVAAGGGTVVINCSDQWFVGKPGSFAYGLTKGALGQITRSLAIDLGPKNVRVNAVCAGTIHTPLVDKLVDRYEKEGKGTAQQFWAEEDALFPLGRSGKPEEVAELVFFLAGEKSSFITGGHYLIDGGLVAG